MCEELFRGTKQLQGFGSQGTRVGCFSPLPHAPGALVKTVAEPSAIRSRDLITYSPHFVDTSEVPTGTLQRSYAYAPIGSGSARCCALSQVYQLDPTQTRLRVSLGITGSFGLPTSAAHLSGAPKRGRSSRSVPFGGRAHLAARSRDVLGRSLLSKPHEQTYRGQGLLQCPDGCCVRNQLITDDG